MNSTAAVKCRQVYEGHGCHLEIRRVARDQSWADVFVYQLNTGATWSKRQPLPLFAEAQRVS